MPRKKRRQGKTIVSRWAEGRNLDPENPDRQGSGEQTVEEALYVIGRVIDNEVTVVHMILKMRSKQGELFKPLTFQGRTSWGEM